MSSYTFNNTTFHMDDILDITEGWNDEQPAVFCIIVYSKTGGKQFFDRTLSNRMVMHSWQQADLGVKLAKEQKANLNVTAGLVNKEVKKP